MEKYNLATFHSTHLALKFERTLNSENIEIKIIPVPREISASCGLAGRFLKSDYEQIAKVLNKYKLEYDLIYEYIDGKYKSINDNK